MPIAVNAEGKALRLEGGAWVPTDIAQNEKGELVAYDGMSWTPLPAAQPKPAPTMADGAKNVMQGMTDTISASLQGASPVVRSMDGQAQQRRLGNLIEMDYGPAIEGVNDPRGGPMKVDPSKHVVLRDPDSGGLSVYERGQGTAGTIKDILAGLGRLLSFGMTAQPTLGMPRAAAPNAAAAAVRDFERVGIDPSIAAASTGRTAPLMAQTIRNAPLVGDFAVGNGIEQRLTQAKDAAGRVAGMYGEATDAAQGGRALQRGAESFRADGSKFAAKADELYANVERLIPQSQPVPATSTQTTLSGLTRKFPNSETLSDVTAKPALAKLQQGLTEGQLSYEEIKGLRSWVGEQLSAKTKTFPDIAEKDWRALYASMTEDMRAAARASGPDALKAFDRANKFYSAGATRATEKLDGILNAGSPEKAFNQIMLAARAKPGSADAQKVWSAMRSMPAEDWKEVAAAVVSELGRGRDGGFSVAMFAKNYNELSEPAKTALFAAKGTGEARQSLEALARSAERLTRMETYQNRSNSASQGMQFGALAGVGTFPLETISTLVGGGVIGKVLMNPSAARVMARLEGATSTKEVTQRVAEIETLIQTQRGISTELTAVRDALRGLLQPRPMAAPASEEREKR